MCGEIEIGKCTVCGESKSVQRKYYRYDINCDCCSNQHFEIVYHCSSCDAKPPKTATVHINPLNPPHLKQKNMELKSKKAKHLKSLGYSIREIASIMKYKSPKSVQDLLNRS